MGIPNFLNADSRLTLLGESVADLLEILCLFGAAGRPTLLGESIAEPCLTLRGVKVPGLCSSAELTLYLEGRVTCVVRTILIAPVSAREGTCGGA